MIAFTASRPIPWREKTVSTITAPPISDPNCSPTSVVAGINALFKRMAQRDAVFRKPLRAGDVDVFLSERFHHRRTDQPGDHRRCAQTERRGRQNETLQSDRTDGGEPVQAK